MANKASQLASRSFHSARSHHNASLVVAKYPPKRWMSTTSAEASLNSTKQSATKNISSSSTTKGGNVGFVQWYESHLNARPVTTKAITGSILWGLGDGVAQTVPTFFQDADDNKPTADSFQYDFPRTARAVFFGFAIHAPLSHLHFNFLEHLTVRSQLTGYSIPVFKTIMEQFVYWSWFSNSLYHGAMGLMQGMSGKECIERIEDVLWDTQVAQWSFWIPIQLLNFQFVPVRHQLNVVLMTSVVWTALLSAWYPPEAKKEEVGENKTDTVE